MIPLYELVLYYNQQLQINPPNPTLDRVDIYTSTLFYLQLYKETTQRLHNLTGQAANLALNLARCEKEGKLP